MPRERTVAPARAPDIASMLSGGDAPPGAAAERPAGGRPVAAAAAARRRGRPEQARQLPRARRLRGAAAPRSTWARTACCARSSDAKLLGRGGAAFPTGRKWEAVARNAKRPHYLICNADESEPGTFKDRVILESDPFFIVEAMTIAGYATGCEHGYLYLRGEYPLAWERLVDAVTEARARGYLGDNILGQGIRLRHRVAQGRRRVHLRRGDRALQLDRGLPRRAAQQAAVPGRRRAVRQADGHQQRRDARQRPRHRPRRRRRPTRRSAPRTRRARACSA